MILAGDHRPNEYLSFLICDTETVVFALKTVWEALMKMPLTWTVLAGVPQNANVFRLSLIFLTGSSQLTFPVKRALWKDDRTYSYFHFKNDAASSAGE